MRQVTIRELSRELSKQLKDLPFEITKNGKVVGRLLPPVTLTSAKTNEQTPDIPRKIKRDLKDTVYDMPKSDAWRISRKSYPKTQKK